MSILKPTDPSSAIKTLNGDSANTNSLINHALTVASNAYEKSESLDATVNGEKLKDPSGESIYQRDDDGNIIYNNDGTPVIKRDASGLVTIVASKASISQLEAESARIDNLEANSVTTETLNAEKARIDVLETSKANIDDLNAEKARIDNLETGKADISSLTAESARIDTLETTKADISSLNAESARVDELLADKADVSALNTETARIDSLETNKANAKDLTAESARIDILESTKADITSLNAEIARIDTLEAGKADIDLANVNNAWITNGVIKDASIANEKVISVSANKLTAGTIDASKITVTNLNADNITVGTINGARIGDSSIDLGKLSQEVPTKEYLDSVEQKLQEEIDGAIETFTVSEIPTLNNEPAVNWTTDDVKSAHVGDLCYVVNNASDNDGFCYRFQYNGTVYSWALIKDNDVTKAIQDIAELGGEVTQLRTDYTSKVSEIDGGIESLKSRTTTIETTYSTKTYTDNKAGEVLTSANNYADDMASSTLTEANSYADNKASTTLSSAKTYADSTASSTLTSANDYADGKANKALTDANKYTDNTASSTLTSANTYSDNKASDALTSANSYADTKASSALTDAKSYTDSTASNTLGEAKSYTDTATADMATTGDIPTKVSELTNDSSFATTTQVSNAKSEAISTASADATSKANSALDSAKSYTDAVEIGGRNLFRKEWYSVAPWNNAVSSVTFINEECLYVDKGRLYINTNNGTTTLFPNITFEENAQYAISVDYAEAENPSQEGLLYFVFVYSDGSKQAIYMRSKSWTRYTMVSQSNKTVSAITMTYSTNGVNSYIKNLKLEKGNKATDWTPAPEDVDAGIANAQTAADSAASAAANAQTTADTAKTNAATAQSTADTAKSNAAAAQTAADNAQTTADEAKTKAEAAQTAVSTKVETSVFNTLKNTVDENSANITSLTETVTTKADSSTVTTLSNTVNKVKQTADANSSSISNLTTTVNSKADGSKVTALETKTSTIEQNLSGVTTRVTNLESTSDGLDTRLTTAESKITDDAIVSTVTSSKTYKDALSSKVDTSVYNTKMQQLDNSISLKATATDVYTKTQADAAFDAKGSASNAKSEAISSAKSYTDTATTDMATEEFVTSQGYLTVTSDAITSKVSKNEVISAINQTAESISIDARKINLNGAVTISSLDSSLQTTINNKAETSALEAVRTTANNAQTSINNLEIGGRNLIVERNISNGWVNSSGALINSSGYIATDYIPVTPGDTIVFQLWTPSSTQTWINDTYFDSDKNYVTGYNGEYITSNHIIKTYTVPSGASYVRISYSWADGYKAKLEKGNKPTDWSPAPEDVDAGIADAQTTASNAAKTATSYITDINANSGIKVGAKNNANNYVQINSDGMSIYQDINNDDVRVASLGANGIVLGIDKNAQTIVTADGIKIANAGGIVGVSVDSSGITEVATKVVNVYASIRKGSSYTLTLDSSIASGTSLKFKVELDSYPEFSELCTITVGTNKSETFSGNVQFSYVYNATNKQITITANSTDSVVLCFYRYDVASDLPLVQLNGVLEFNGNQQKDVKIEQGTSGNWTYEKWSSGIVKMYYTGTYSSAFNNGNYFGAYRGTAQTLTYPFTLASVTYANVDHVAPNTGFCVLSTCDTTQLKFYPYNRTNQTATQTGIKVIAEVVGRWK